MSSRLTKVSKAASRTLLPSSLESSINSGSTTLFVSSVLHNKQWKKIKQINKFVAKNSLIMSHKLDATENRKNHKDMVPAFQELLIWLGKYDINTRNVNSNCKVI